MSIETASGSSASSAKSDEKTRNLSVEPDSIRKRVQIQTLKEVPTSSSPTGDGNYNSPDVQFILEVKRSNIKVV